MKTLLTSFLLKLLDTSTIISFVFDALDRLAKKSDNTLDDKIVAKLRELSEQLAEELSTQIKKPLKKYLPEEEPTEGRQSSEVELSVPTQPTKETKEDTK